MGGRGKPMSGIFPLGRDVGATGGGIGRSGHIGPSGVIPHSGLATGG